jgi:hypothetical protein
MSAACCARNRWQGPSRNTGMAGLAMRNSWRRKTPRFARSSACRKMPACNQSPTASFAACRTGHDSWNGSTASRFRKPCSLFMMMTTTYMHSRHHMLPARSAEHEILPPTSSSSFTKSPRQPPNSPCLPRRQCISGASTMGRPGCLRRHSRILRRSGGRISGGNCGAGGTSRHLYSIG